MALSCDNDLFQFFPQQQKMNPKMNYPQIESWAHAKSAIVFQKK